MALGISLACPASMIAGAAHGGERAGGVSTAAEESPAWFPTEVGFSAVYRYTVTGGPGGGGSGTQSLGISAPGVWRQVARIEVPHRVRSWGTYAFSIKDGYVVYDRVEAGQGESGPQTLSETYASPLIIVPLDLAPGVSWRSATSTRTRIGSGEAISYYKSRVCTAHSELEAVTVPAGTYRCVVVDCIRTQRSQAGPGVDQEYRVTEWWHQGVGMVRIRMETASGVGRGAVQLSELESVSRR
jgi:hypothetical protein